MNAITHLIPEILAFRPFLPAKEYETSLRFYRTIGFEAHPLGEAMVHLSLGPHAFILHYVDEWVDKPVMHVLVKDVHAWWKHFDSLDLATQFGVSAPGPPRVEPWGLTVLYMSDPSGVFWHFAEPTKLEIEGSARI